VVHDFATKLAEGEAGETLLDTVFSGAVPPTWAHASTEFGEHVLAALANRRFLPTPVNRADQRRGRDRQLTENVTVEYKTDARAQRTHNAFIETVSVDTANKPGWAYSCTATILAYYVPGDELVYVFRPSRLRGLLPAWLSKFPVRRAQNDGYTTEGVCVPLAELERRADAVLSL
jgi:hypothetical protein